MKLKYLIPSLAILIFLISACTNAKTPTGAVVKEPEKTVCNKPYFEFRENDCCLDKNDNSVCDSDEKAETAKEAVVEKKVLEKIDVNNKIRQYNVYVVDGKGFEPKEITINSGDNVTWNNEGQRGMILLIFKDGAQYLQQNAINSGEVFTHQFNEIGSYDVYWNIFEGPVVGKVIVRERSSDVVNGPIEEIKEQLKRGKDYTEEQLKEDLTSIFGSSRYNISNFTRDPSHPDYIRSSELKYHVIHTIKKPINTFEEFCKVYCGKNWDGWAYYINISELSLYTPLLGRENFSAEKEYKDYVKDRELANNTKKERIYEVENGKVLEYKFWLLQQDDFGNFEANLMPYLVVYKVYCTPNMTVLIRPRWEDFSVSDGGKLTELIINWELEDDRVREEILERANKILKLCPVEKNFFDNYDFEPYFESDLRNYYWRMFYAHDINLTRAVEIGAEKLYKERDVYILKNVSISFTNHHIYPIYDVGLKVTVKADDEKIEYDYYNKKDFKYEFKSGEEIIKTLRLKEIHFLNNITIKATLYLSDYDVEIRPLEVTFTKSDLGFE